MRPRQDSFKWSDRSLGFEKMDPDNQEQEQTRYILQCVLGSYFFSLFLVFYLACDDNCEVVGLWEASQWQIDGTYGGNRGAMTPRAGRMAL